MPSAAVVIGALRVKIVFLIHCCFNSRNDVPQVAKQNVSLVAIARHRTPSSLNLFGNKCNNQIFVRQKVIYFENM